MKAFWWYFLGGVAFLSACAQPKAHKEWMSIPPAQTLETSAFQIRLEPLRKDKPFFVVFNLAVTNKSDRPLSLDWNQTRYLHNGVESGPFVFSGIDPATIKDKNIPPEAIPPGATLQREIFPAGLVAYTPMREELLNQQGRGLFPGPLPAGKNGIRLVIQQNGHKTIQDLVVEIR